jgi:hypothetical protein
VKCVLEETKRALGGPKHGWQLYDDFFQRSSYYNHLQPSRMRARVKTRTCSSITGTLDQEVEPSAGRGVSSTLCPPVAAPQYLR